MTTSFSRRALRIGLSALLVSFLTVLGLTAPAQAHDRLLESVPAADSTLNEAPEEIALTFSADVESIGSSVELRDSDGNALSVGSLEGEGSTVTADINDELTAGDYEVRWRVVSSDGHPISGVTPFTVKGTTSSSSPSGSSSVSESPSTADESTSTTQATEDTEVREQGGNSASSATVLRGAVGVVVVLGLLLAFVWWRRSQRER
ncbi:copper resistance CopC family protein [Janibacter alittae]|uniref:Copper resistance protein CopC n=1 Tax=Janibacter alittae TaxID=3115209 RepID=A0ABZ2MLE2_9MICO